MQTVLSHLKCYGTLLCVLLFPTADSCAGDQFVADFVMHNHIESY